MYTLYKSTKCWIVVLVISIIMAFFSLRKNPRIPLQTETLVVFPGGLDVMNSYRKGSTTRGAANGPLLSRQELIRLFDTGDLSVLPESPAFSNNYTSVLYEYQDDIKMCFPYYFVIVLDNPEAIPIRLFFTPTRESASNILYTSDSEFSSPNSNWTSFLLEGVTYSPPLHLTTGIYVFKGESITNNIIVTGRKYPLRKGALQGQP